VSTAKATRQGRLLPDVDVVFVLPHRGDGGVALGAALGAAADAGAMPRIDLGRLDLGPAYDRPAVEAALRAAGLPPACAGDLPSRVADLLADGRIVMWFQGAMEYGPRALGQRSVLARPDRPELRDRLNLVLKRRVWYQPFCPSMLESEASRLLADWTGGPNRSMTMAYKVVEQHRAHLAGATSIDGTCRPQIVADDDAGPFAELLRDARRHWQVAAVLNTSFNIHGEPLVCTPGEAVDVFLRSGADALAIGPFLVGRPA
jgi:carbamoyltransferase